MPELAEVETPKNAGFVQSKSTRNANKKRIEQDEAELKALMEGGSSSDEEADTKEAEANTEVKEEYGSAIAAARAGEVAQKTYSGYDLGRNVVAKYGGERYKNGGMRLGTPRYGHAS